MNLRALLIVLVAVGCQATVLAAEKEKKGADLSRARDTTDRIRQADPPQVQRSTGTPSAAEIARQENERERQRQAEEARRRQLDNRPVPPPSR